MVSAWAPIRNSRRSMMSASAPPGSASRNTGRMVAACTMATTIGLGSRLVISQPAPVFCSQVPTQTTTLAIHSRRNMRLRSGSRAGGSVIGARSFRRGVGGRFEAGRLRASRGSPKACYPHNGQPRNNNAALRGGLRDAECVAPGSSVRAARLFRPTICVERVSRPSWRYRSALAGMVSGFTPIASSPSRIQAPIWRVPR